MEGFLDGLANVLLFVPRKVFGWIADLIIWSFDIDVPDYVVFVNDYIGTMPAAALYILDVFEFELGLSMIMGTFIVVWVFKKMPFIGGK